MNRCQVNLALAVLAALSLGLSGCGKGEHDNGHKDHDHGDHSHPPPRGGIMIELGEHEFQVEFKIQKDLGVFTMWIMDGHAEDPVRIKAPTVLMKVHAQDGDKSLNLQAVANENTGESVGDTSQFSAPIEEVGTEGSFKATIPKLTIRGRDFTDVKLDYDPAKVKP